VLTLLTTYDRGPRHANLGPDSLSRLVLERAHMSIPSNRPVVRKRLFNVASRIITTCVTNASPDHLLECAPYLPELAGQSPITPLLGKGSGLDSVLITLDALGLSETAEEMTKLLSRVKARSLETKGLVSLDDFAATAEDVLGQNVVSAVRD
jgi:isopropylmalate/homocitrate/citramalate synthase